MDRIALNLYFRPLLLKHMRKLLLALAIIPTCAFGQVSLRPYVGGGYGTVSEQGFKSLGERSGAFIQNAGVAVVYELNNWFVSAGAGYLSTGVTYDLGTLNMSSPSEPALYWTDVTIISKYQHLTIPLTVGRILSLQKFSLLPEVGIDLSYNLSQKSKMRSTGGPNTDYRKNDHFSNDYNRISIFAGVSLMMSYKLTDRLSVFCGPSYKYMVTSILNHHTNALTGASLSQNHQAILLNAGVYIGFPK